MAGDRSDQERAYALLELGDELIHSRALQIVAELRIADLLASEPRPCEELAQHTDTDPQPSIA